MPRRGSSLCRNTRRGARAPLVRTADHRETRARAGNPPGGCGIVGTFREPAKDPRETRTAPLARHLWAATMLTFHGRGEDVVDITPQHLLCNVDNTLAPAVKC